MAVSPRLCAEPERRRGWRTAPPLATAGTAGVRLRRIWRKSDREFVFIAAS